MATSISSPPIESTLPNPYTNSSPSTSTFAKPASLPFIICIAIFTLIFLLAILGCSIGLIRMRRHPERYGPQPAFAGRPGQSRAKGLARAVVESIPIVRFRGGERKDLERGSEVGGQEGDERGGEEVRGKECSICIEDFGEGEETRVLPCRHRFHPKCIDPWLQNISGTCPICRYDLSTTIPTPIPVPEPALITGANSSQNPTTPTPAENQTPTIREAEHRVSRLTELREALQAGPEEYMAALRRLHRDHENRRRGSRRLSNRDESGTGERQPTGRRLAAEPRFYGY